MTIQNNPLLQEFDHAPFSKIENEHFKPAIIKAIEMAREEINAIASNADEATFPNTIETLEFFVYVQNKIQCWAIHLSPIE